MIPNKLRPLLLLAIAYIVFTKLIAPVFIKRASRPRRKGSSLESLVNAYSKVKQTRFNYPKNKKVKKVKVKKKPITSWQRIVNKSKKK